MVSIRPVHFRNNYVYHIFNRGVERRNIFLSPRDYERFVLLLEYYRFADIPKSFSHYLNLPIEQRKDYYDSLKSHPRQVDILAFCLMPNHFHLIVRQKKDQGIVSSISNIANGYAKYFNTKRKRVGPLFQGPFKGVIIESDEQLIHVSRYIHLNPVVTGVIEEKEMFTYSWSSLLAYVENPKSSWVETETVLSHFPNSQAYQKFVRDQISFGKELEKIKHLILEEV